MSDGLVENLGEGNWLIKPTGEIRKCSRSTAYRIAKKAEKGINKGDIKPIIEEEKEAPADSMPPPGEDETIEEKTSVMDGSPLEITFNRDEITVETPVFDLPSLEDLKGGDEGDGDIPDTFQGGESQSRDEGFIHALKGAKVIEDDKGNKKVHIKDIFIGDNPLINGLLRFCDHSLYDWAENKYGIELWDNENRKTQRIFYVKILSLVAPKTSIQLDPSLVVIIMTGWLYGVPILRIARLTRKNRIIAKAVNPYENQEELR